MRVHRISVKRMQRIHKIMSNKSQSKHQLNFVFMCAKIIFSLFFNFLNKSKNVNHQLFWLFSSFGFFQLLTFFQTHTHTILFIFLLCSQSNWLRWRKNSDVVCIICAYMFGGNVYMNQFYLLVLVASVGALVPTLLVAHQSMLFNVHYFCLLFYRWFKPRRTLNDHINARRYISACHVTRPQAKNMLTLWHTSTRIYSLEHRSSMLLLLLLSCLFKKASSKQNINLSSIFALF